MLHSTSRVAHRLLAPYFGQTANSAQTTRRTKTVQYLGSEMKKRKVLSGATHVPLEEAIPDANGRRIIKGLVR